MKIALSHIRGKGDLKKERVVFKVLGKTDIGQYLLCESTTTSTAAISSKLRKVYWFPDKLVNEGDFIAVYTGLGRNGEYTNKAGTVTHQMYWGLSESLWGETNSVAVLMEIADWSTKRLPGSD